MLNTLIVEDNAAYRQSLNQLLAERFPSMQIAEAADGEEALRHALSRRLTLSSWISGCRGEMGSI